MEMMVVLLIVAIVAAAAAPMVNKKILATAGEKSPWVFTGDGQDIAYDINNKSHAIIGGANPLNSAKLSIGFPGNNANGSLSPHIALRRSNNNNNDNNHVSLYANDYNLVFSSVGMPVNVPGITAFGVGTQHGFENATVYGYKAKVRGENSVAVGQDAQGLNGDNVVAVGQDAKAYNAGTAVGQGAQAYNASTALGQGAQAFQDGATAIGQDAKAENAANATVVGQGARAENANMATVVGQNAEAGGERAIALGHMAVASGVRAIAIGDHAKAEAYGIAIGDRAGAVANSVAIGNYVNSYDPKTIVLGDSETKVIIQGSLQIDKNLFVGISTENDGIVKANNLAVNGNTTVGGTLDVIGATTLNNTLDVTGNTTLDGHLNKVRLTNGGGLEVLSSGRAASPNNTGYVNVVTFLSSDRRLKNVGEAFTAGLEEIKKLEVFNYTFKKDESKTPRVGVMAQDLEKIFPKAVFKGEDGFLRIRMEDMFYALVNAVKQLDAKIEELKKNEILTLKNRLDDLEKANKELVKLNKDLQKQNEDLIKENKKFEKRLDKLEKKLDKKLKD